MAHPRRVGCRSWLHWAWLRSLYAAAGNPPVRTTPLPSEPCACYSLQPMSCICISTVSVEDCDVRNCVDVRHRRVGGFICRGRKWAQGRCEHRPPHVRRGLAQGGNLQARLAEPRRFRSGGFCFVSRMHAAMQSDPLSDRARTRRLRNWSMRGPVHGPMRDLLKALVIWTGEGFEVTNHAKPFHHLPRCLWKLSVDAMPQRGRSLLANIGMKSPWQFSGGL
jgi:hypothetical protein